MAEYIDREAFLKDAETRYCMPCKRAGKDYNGLNCRACWVDDMMGDVDDAPAADVAPVVHGRWVDKAVHNEMEIAVKDILCDEFGDVATVKVTKSFADLYRTEDKHEAD